MRVSSVKRVTLETSINVSLKIEGSGAYKVKTPIPFLNHMLETLCLHSMMDVTIEASGDLTHHIVEDIALTLGLAIRKALGDREGLKRFGFARVPMDDALAEAVVDLIDRPYAVVDLKLTNSNVEGLDSMLIEHFIRSLAYSIPATLHVNVVYGYDDHHKVEASFKALALALKDAWTIVGKPLSVKRGYKT